MNKIVKHNRRYSAWSRGNNPKAWTVITEYQGKDIAPQSVIPSWLRDRWAATKSGLGYANFQHFTAEEALRVIALAKTGAVSLGVNRWGRVSCYKIQPARS